ncbi:Serine/threonine protein phosphatase, partial [Dysosmobacter welbionis]
MQWKYYTAGGRSLQQAWCAARKGPARKSGRPVLSGRLNHFAAAFFLPHILLPSLSHIPKPEKAQRMEKMGTMKMNQQYGIYSVPQPSTSITYSVATPQGTMGA